MARRPRHQDGREVQGQSTLNDRDSSTAANYFYNVGPDGAEATPYRAIFGKVNSGLPLTAVSKTKQFGIYVQDDWAVNDKLTLNLGVRWDYEKSPRSSTTGRCSQPSTRSTRRPTVQRRTGNQTYAQSAGGWRHQRQRLHQQRPQPQSAQERVQPRLGFSYDLNGDEEHVIYGGAGRAYDRNLFDVSRWKTPRTRCPSTDVFFENPTAVNGCGPGNADGVSCLVWDPKYLDAANLQGLGSRRQPKST